MPELEELDEDEYNYGDHAPRPTQGAMKELTDKVAAADVLSVEVSELKSLAAQKERLFNDLIENHIPQLMKDIGL